MTYLLDTQILLYFLSEDPKLSREAVSFIESHQAALVTSVISSWEIAIKKSLGKLNVVQDPIKFMLERGIACLPFELGDVDVLAGLPLFHKDPFDRALISQALARHLVIITMDKVFARYSDHIKLV